MRPIRSLAVASATTVLLLIIAAGARAQGPSLHSVTLEEAVNYALKNYPAIEIALERAKAAQSGIALARTGYLPQLNAVYQANRATQNQVDGIFLPSSITPSVEGPVQPYSGSNYWNTQAGVLFSWEPADFGLRRSQVGVAESRDRKSQADIEVARLQVAAAVGDYFFSIVAARQGVIAAEAHVDRWETFARTVQTLVQNELRPGADASRAQAEVARARTEFDQAQGVEEQAEAILASLISSAGTPVQAEPGLLVSPPPVDSLPPTPAAANPIAADGRALVDQAHAEEQVLRKEDYPRLFVQSEVFSRGSGVNPDGTDAGGVKGLGFATANWVAGFTVMFPNLLDFRALNDQKRIAKANELAQVAHYNQELRDLNGQIAAAGAALKAARLVASDTPLEVEAARQAETQARTRYQSALTNIVEVAEAEDLLAQAEADDAAARIKVWHGLFAVAVAEGNLQPFWDLLHAGSGGRP